MTHARTEKRVIREVLPSIVLIHLRYLGCVQDSLTIALDLILGILWAQNLARKFGRLNLPLLRALKKTVLRGRRNLDSKQPLRADTEEGRCLLGGTCLPSVLLQNRLWNAERFLDGVSRVLRTRSLCPLRCLCGFSLCHSVPRYAVICANARIVPNHSGLRKRNHFSASTYEA